MAEQWAPWLSDPDAPAVMTSEENTAFAAAVAAAYPELIDHSMDGPIKPDLQRERKAVETDQQRRERIAHEERKAAIARTPECDYGK